MKNKTARVGDKPRESVIVGPSLDSFLLEDQQLEWVPDDSFPDGNVWDLRQKVSGKSVAYVGVEKPEHGGQAFACNMDQEIADFTSLKDAVYWILWGML